MSPRRGASRKPARAQGRARGGQGGRRGRGSWRRTLGGLLVLGLAGFGVWIAAGVVDDDTFVPRSLESGGGAGVARPPIPAPGNRIRVEVLNAGGVPGVAAAVRDDLRDAGFDVVHYGNASSFGRESSTVVLRSGDASAAQAVADRLGIEQVLVEHDPALLVEVTVLLGSGWRPRDAQDATPDRNP